jgi:putative colanic acid biosynthesis UDP-glucose lipid carrier transferase
MSTTVTEPHISNDGSSLTVPASKTRKKLRLSRKVAADLVGVADIAAVVMGFLLPAMIYSHAGGIVADWQLLFQAGFAAGVIVHLLLRFNGMYATEKMHDFPHHPGRLLFIITLTMAGLMGLGVPHAIRSGHQWIWFSVALSAGYTLLLFNRAIAHPLFGYLTRIGAFDERIAVFGAGQIARRVKEHLSVREHGIHFAGVYDDRMGDDRLNPEGVPVSGRLEDLIKAARNDEIDKIIIALPQSADQRIASVAQKLEALPVSLHIVTHISSDLVDGGPAHNVSAVGSVGLLDVKKKPLHDWGPFLKRAEDLLVGSLLLLATLPLFPLIALAIKIDSPGPVFFRQRRSGLNLRPVDVWKFRTMAVQRPEDEALQATPGDQRVTRIGRLLRRTSFDELPQLFNVLKGDMSLVGPRPHLPVHDERFGEMMETYAHRHQVKPGLTGLAQVKGFRGETRSQSCIEGRVHADLDYIRNWSLGLDLKILVRTIWAVLTGRNAH